MITIENIIDAINDLILTKYPTHTFYIEEIPQGFERPSFYIQLITDSSTTANKSTTIENPSFQVVYFGIMNKHNLTSVHEKLSVYQTIKDLFKTGYIKVLDKVIKLSENGINGELRKNEVFFTIDFEYFENRPVSSENSPYATDVKITTKEV